MKKRFICIILCLIVFTALLPTAILATNTEISSVAVTGVTEPSAGQTLDYSVSVSENCTLNSDHWAQQNGVYWMRSPFSDLTIGQIVTSDHIVEAGYVYYCNVTVVPNGGRSFAGSFSATVNGNYASTDNTSNGGKVIAYGFRVELPKITSVSVTDITLPTDGGYPDFSGICNSECVIQNIEWMDLDTDTYMTASDAFREGGSYRVTVTLTASEGYEWGDQYGYVVQGSLNGIPVSVRISNGTAVIEYDFEAGGHVCAPKSVAKQNATCTVPGKEAHYQCDCGKIYYDAAARQPINDLSALTIPAAHKDENSDVFCDVCGAQLGEIPVSTETTTVTTAATSAPETTTPTSETTAASETTASTEAAATAPQTTAATEVTTAVPETTTVPETTSAPETAATPETTAAPETAATTEATTAVPETTAAVTDVSAEQSEKPADGNEDKKSRTKKTVIIAGSAVTAVSGGAAALYFGLRKKF